MKDIQIKISKETRKITELSRTVIGNDGENLQGKFVFSFDDEFVNGQPRLEYQIEDTKAYIPLTKEDETYTIPIRSVLTKEGKLYLQLVITEGTQEDEIPIFKSNVFYVVVNESINAELIEPSEYPSWLDLANAKLNQIDNLDINATKEGHTATVTITKKDGSQQSVEIYDGEKGDKGDCNFATFDIVNGDLIMNTIEDMLITFELDDLGHLVVVI